MRPPVDQALGLVGAAIGVVLVTGLVAALDPGDGAFAAILWAPLALLLYPLSAVLGYDLATGGGDAAGAGGLLRVGGYAVAVATAHAAVAAGMAVGVAADLHRDSGLWIVPVLLCWAAAAAGRLAAVRLARTQYLSPAALIPAALVILCLAWWGFYAAMFTNMDRIDS